MSEVDDYLDSLDPSTRAAFERVLSLVTEVVPEAEGGKSYGMAALKYKRRPLLGFLATKDHLSLFPFSPGVVDQVRDRLGGYEISKGTIRFTTGTPLPEEVVRDLARLRADEISAATR